jgi:hypothetical protein
MVKSCFCRCEMYSDVCIEMKILILYSAIGSMATVDSALFSSSAIRVIKMVVLPLLYISLNLSLAKLATPHNSALRQAPLRRLRHGICVAKMLDNVGLRYPHRASVAKKPPRTLRPLPLLRFAVSATGGAHLCSIQYYLRFWLSICRTSLAVSALRIMRYCLFFITYSFFAPNSNGLSA